MCGACPRTAGGLGVWAPCPRTAGGLGAWPCPRTLGGLDMGGRFALCSFGQGSGSAGGRVTRKWCLTMCGPRTGGDYASRSRGTPVGTPCSCCTGRPAAGWARPRADGPLPAAPAADRLRPPRVRRLGPAAGAAGRRTSPRTYGDSRRLPRPGALRRGRPFRRRAARSGLRRADARPGHPGRRAGQPRSRRTPKGSTGSRAWPLRTSRVPHRVHGGSGRARRTRFIARSAEIRQNPARLLDDLRRELTDSDRTDGLDAGDPLDAAANFREAAAHFGVRLDRRRASRSAGPWGFDPADIRCPVMLWHGVKDVFSRRAPLLAGSPTESRGARRSSEPTAAHFDGGVARCPRCSAGCWTSRFRRRQRRTADPASAPWLRGHVPGHPGSHRQSAPGPGRSAARPALSGVSAWSSPSWLRQLLHRLRPQPQRLVLASQSPRA